MTRPIKFRVWLESLKSYHEHLGDTDFMIAPNGELHLINADGGEKYTGDYTIEQFTGLHDKNGKEIYEGDVITFNDSRLTNIVEYREGQYMAKQSGTFGSYIGLGYCDWKKNVVIIGNIHEQS